MTDLTRYRHAFAAIVAATTLGCASAAPPEAPPRPVVEAVTVPGISLDPSPADLRAAERAPLTGFETGRMWTFDDPPLALWKDAYGISTDAAWLERVRLASLRLGEYCSAAFVSADGLAVTNQHCARECVESVSTARTDYLVEGFVADNRREERLCPGLFVDRLVAIEDVTDRMNAVAHEWTDPIEWNRALREAGARIEDECEKVETRAHCQVVPLYHGARHALYRYRRYEPVKLVFAPELQAAYFGGDYDNFTYPRYSLDVAFLRVYEGADPVETDAYLPIDPDGAAEGEAVFVSGNPGSTSRILTVAQLMYEREYRLPLRIWVLNQQKRTLEAYATANPELEDELRQDAFEVANSLKGYTGMLEGLRDSLLVGQKIRWERAFRERLSADPALRAEYGDVWDRLAAIQKRKLGISARLNATNATLFGSTHMDLALTLVDYVRQSQLPEEERAPRFRGDAGRRLRVTLESDVPVEPPVAWLTLTGHLEFLDRWLPPDDPLKRLLIEPGETVEKAAARLIEQSQVLDAAFRGRLLDGGAAAIEASTDPLIAYAWSALRQADGLWAEWEAITAQESIQKRRLGQALCAVFGTAIAPDATFTLRISDGVVKRYPMNGTYAPALTTFHGLFARAAEFGTEPWKLPPSFVRSRTRIDMDTPLNFVTTSDITGGSSGSPVIDSDGRLVGIVFDSNIEQLPNEYLYRTGAGRTVAVHSAGILEALRSIYRANALVSELTARGRLH